MSRTSRTKQRNRLLLFATLVLASAGYGRAQDVTIATRHLAGCAGAVTATESSSLAAAVTPVRSLAAVPARPTRQPLITRRELLDAAGFVAGRTLDWWTTERNLAQGGKEYQLPDALVRNSKGFLAYSEGIAAGEILLEHKLDRSPRVQHSRFARMAVRVGVAVAESSMLAQDWQNWERRPRTR